MNLSEIKLVATDMDGTLLNSNHEVSSAFFKLFKALQAENIIFVAASGRPYYSIINKLAAIKDDIIVVAENGALVIAQDSVILSTPLHQKDLIHIDKALTDDLTNIYPVYCTKNKAYFKNISIEFIDLLSEYYPNYEIISSISEIKETVFKVAIYNQEDSEKNIYPLFKHLETHFKIKISGKNWLDISHNLANKGHAITQLQRLHNITPNQTLTFGDYDNDIEMLEQSTFSFAMENANAKIKDIAAHQTSSNNDYGVELVLQKVIDAVRTKNT